MYSMLDLDEPIKPYLHISNYMINHRLGFVFFTFVDLVGMVYKIFPQGKDEILLENQRP